MKADQERQAGMYLTRTDIINLLGSEKLRFELAVILAGGSHEKVAEILDVSLRYVYRRQKDFGIKVIQ